MAIHWQIKFKSLRAGTDYTVNVYDSAYSGSPVVLKGGGSPFATEEDATDDQFTPIRTQSGYLRIIDDGKAADGTTTFRWQDFVPQNDFSRPVTLTAGNTVVWQGYIQAQNFSARLYDNPQEREFPVQCILSVLNATDVTTSETDIHNFAWVLNYLVGKMKEDTSPITVDHIYLQGGGFAREFLRKRIDWQNFVDVDDEGVVTGRFDHYTMLEDICKFWGWTARTHGRDIWFTCSDDTDLSDFLQLTPAQLASLATGDSGTIGSIVEYGEMDIDDYDAFLSIDNDDIMVRGASKATVTADWNSSGSSWFTTWPTNITKQMLEMGWGTAVMYQTVVDSKTRFFWAQYTNRKASVSTGLVNVTCSEQGSLCLARFAESEFDLEQYQGAMHMKKLSSTPYIQIETVFSHIYDGKFQIKADVYSAGNRYTKSGVSDIKTITMRFGIGKTRATAKWYNGNNDWVTTPTDFYAHVGFSDGKWRFGYLNGGTHVYITDSIDAVKDSNGQEGKIFIDLYSTEDFNVDIYPANNEIDLTGFQLTYQRMVVEYLGNEMVYGDMTSRREYTEKNGKMSKAEWNCDVIYASGKVDSDFGFGLVFNPTNRPMSNGGYPGGDEPPEQHLVNRVANYWRMSRRMMTVHINPIVTGNITPGMMVTADTTWCHPIAIGREWRDDEMIVTLLEMEE